MKAAVLTSIRHIDFVQLPEPQIQEDDDVKVQIHYVCLLYTSRCV